MTFEQYLIENVQPINELIDQYFVNTENADLTRYLYGPLREYSNNAGKRHRPLICLLACKAVGGDPIDAMRSAMAIENFHTAALIHDDIADDSKTRRGKTCMHLEEGFGIAINAGDFALASVIATIVGDPRLDDRTKLRVVDEVTEMDKSTIEGQALDIGWARDGRYDITTEDYLLMATRKTAVYSGGAPLAIGAIIGGATDEQIEALREYGTLTGLAFQIQDDLLNLIGSAESTKKDFRSDITEGKRTFTMVSALQDEEVRTELIGIIDAHTENEVLLARAVELMDRCGAIEASKRYAQELIDKAKTKIAGQLEESEELEILMSMADYFVDRLR